MFWTKKGTVNRQTLMFRMKKGIGKQYLVLQMEISPTALVHPQKRFPQWAAQVTEPALRRSAA